MTTPASRREFMRLGTLASAVAVSSGGVGGAAAPGREVQEAIERALAAPLFRKALWREPVPIASVDVLKAPGQFLIRVRSQDGAVGTAVGHPDVLETTWPILTERVAPFFIKKDARELEALIDGVYLANSNYKWQGLPFWVPVASLEFAILDLLGKVASQATRRAVQRDDPSAMWPCIARAGTAATHPRKRSPTFSAWSGKPARRRSSSASARA